MDDFLSWGGFTLAPPDYLCENIATLYSGAVRGGTRLVPGIAGVRTYPRRRTLTTYTLEVVVFGVDVEVVQVNMEALIAACEPIGTGDGTRTVTWHRSGALPDLTVDCIIDLPSFGDAWNDAVRATIDLSVPYANGIGWT